MRRGFAILACTIAASLVIGERAPAQTSGNGVPKAHRHPNLATENEKIPEFRVIDTALAASTPRENVVSDAHGRYQAFTVADTQLFVRDRKTGQTRKIGGVPFPWRPFANLVWADDRTLMFDRWSSPHYAVHYAVDLARGTLVSALTFHDQ